MSGTSNSHFSLCQINATFHQALLYFHDAVLSAIRNSYVASDMKNLTHYLNQFGINQTDQLLQLFTRRIVPKGSMLLRPPQIENAISYIDKGLFRLYLIDDNGKEIITDLLVENEFATNYISFVARRPSSIYVEALEDSIVYEISYQSLQTAYLAYPQFERLGRLITEQYLMRLVDMVEKLKTQKSPDSLRDLLLVKPELFQRIPQYQLASYLGISPEWLSKTRKKILSK